MTPPAVREARRQSASVASCFFRVAVTFAPQDEHQDYGEGEQRSFHVIHA
jgi:hypothetical protein